MPKGRSPGIAILDLQDALQSMPVRKAVGKADQRSQAKTERMFADLEMQGRPSEIAKLLELRTQRYVALRTAAYRGQASSPVLNDLLSGVLEQARALSYGEKQGTFVHQTINGKNVREDISYVGVPKNFIDEKVPWATLIGNPGGYANLQDCLNWFGNVGGTGYFWIVFKRSKRDARVRFFVYDIRTPSELAIHRKGKTLKKELRANKVLRKYGNKYGIHNTGGPNVGQGEEGDR